MIFLLLINLLLACEFNFVYNQDINELSYNIPQAEFTALGIWTRYYAFYLDISMQKVRYQCHGRQFDTYQIMTGSYNDGTYLDYFLIKENQDLRHFLIFNNQYEGQYLEFEYGCSPILEYIINDGMINIILVNTKTDQFEQQYYFGLVKQINQIKLFGEALNKYPFSGQIQFTYSQSPSVKFSSGDQLLTYLKFCNIDNSCTQNHINQIISGIIKNFNDQFNSYPYQIIQDSYWIDGWFIFIPTTQIQKYNNLIIQLVQQGRELLKYNGIIPIKISLNFDKNNLSNNGITVETSSYTRAIWDDNKLNLLKFQIFNESYSNLLQNWVYFKFLQYDQVDHNAEFYLSFSEQNYVQKNMGQLNLFKYGNFTISLGQSQLNPYSFLGQIANINIQSCVLSYSQLKRNCHPTCLTCFGPMDYNCLSCQDSTLSNRVFNPITNNCRCKAGFIEVQQQEKCLQIQNLMKSTTFQQIQIEQSELQPCKEGQFQYQIGELIKCYDCPQQSSSGLLCADCLENLITWQDRMVCSYDYYQFDNNNNNIFIKYDRPKPKIDYYYIKEGELLFCFGCNLDILRENFYIKIADNKAIFGSCHSNYYVKNSSCIPCVQNCEYCDDIGECIYCQIGYVLYNSICLSCPDNCLTCQYINQIICDQCLQGFGLLDGKCSQCDTNCLLCEFDAYLDRLKCRICKYNGYFLPFDGSDCVKNSIQNCLIQYQQQIQYFEKVNQSHLQTSNFSGIDLKRQFNIKTTLGLEKIHQPHFSVVIKQIITNNCALCQQHYMNADTQCIYNETVKSDEQVLIKNNYGQCCLNIKQYDQNGNLTDYVKKCQDEYFEEQGIECERKILNTELIYLISQQNLNKIVVTDCEIDQCIQCLYVQNTLKCIQCLSGYYAEILSGLCFQCPQQINCRTCQQQNKNDKDGWKWRIRAYSIYQMQQDLLSSLNQNDYEVICLICPEGYMLFDNNCILNCPNNCKQCSIIDGQNTCILCGQNDQSKFLTVKNNQCQICPQNCEFCQPRSLQEIQTINNLFNPDDPSKYYYSYICLKPKPDSGIFYNQFLQQYVNCRDRKFCKGQINIKLKAHCDDGTYINEKSKYTNEQDFYFENIKMSTLEKQSLFQNIETPQFIEYLNSYQIGSLVYEVTLISSDDDCTIQNFVTIVPRNVFTMLQTKLIINANSLTLHTNSKISNFSEVEIKQCRLQTIFVLQIYHPNQLIVRFQDIQILFDEEDEHYFQIKIFNPLRIELESFFLNTIQKLDTPYKYIISYGYTETSTANNLYIYMDQFYLVQCEYLFLDFLILEVDPKIKNLVLFISNSWIESTFQNSSFIKQQQIINNGSIYLINVTFIIQAYRASIIYLNGYLNLYCSEIILKGSFTNSYFIRTNKFNIIDSIISKTNLHASTIFDNNIKSFNGFSNEHQLNNLSFDTVLFDEESNFIRIFNQPGNDQLEMKKIQLINCQLMNQLQRKNNFSLIMFEGAKFILKDSFFNKSIIGLIDLSIKYCKFVIIDNITVQGTYIQGLQNKLNCLQQLVVISLQNSFIQLQDIQSIELMNSQFNNIMTQNYPIIGIVSLNDNREYDIQLTNLSFINNLILITQQTSQASIFQLISTKAGSFRAINVSFTENIVNQYLQNKFENSATTFLIEAEQFNITLNYTKFIKNQMFNSSDSILYIKAKQIVIQHSTFTKSNIYDDFILRFVIWGFSLQNNFFQENLSEIFPILSLGGNAKFVVDKLFISDCQFSHSIAFQGSGLHLTLQSFLQISETAFTNLRNKVDKDESQGGSIYINLIALNATIEIKNSIFANSSSFQDGGALFINSKYTSSNITLSQIRVQNCYSFKGTFISVYLNSYSFIKITNTHVLNKIQGFQNFLSQFQDLNDKQIQLFHQNSAIIYIQDGSLQMSDSIFSDIQSSSILYVNQASNQHLSGIVIQNIQFSSLGLIQIYPKSDLYKTIFIQNIIILNCSNVQPQKIFCQIDKISYSNDFECQSNDNKPTSLNSYPLNQDAKLHCLQNKLLDFPFQSYMIYVNMIQISDYLYVSDLNMRNNNCSLCKDGMVIIKNVDINTPEFNNIILKQLQFTNNSCGSGCLVISQQQYINIPTRRLLQNSLYQTRFSIPSTVTLEQSEFFINIAQNGIIIVSDLSLSVIDNKFIKNTGFELSGGILYLGNQNQTFYIMTSEISDSMGNKGGAFFLGNKTISSTELLQILLSSNKATSFGQDLVDTPQVLTISLDSGKTLQHVKYITKTPIIIQEIVIKPYRILGNNTLQQFITLPTGYNIRNYKYYDEKLKQFIPYNLTLRLIALNNLKEQVFNLSNSYCTLSKRKININNYDDQPFEEFVQKILFNITSQDYNLDELVINFDPYQSYEYVLQLKFNCTSIQIPIINISSPYNIIGYSDNYELRINIRTFKCQRGESYNSQLGTCNLCDSSQQQYSVVIQASKCSLQDEITMKSVKSTLIELKQNYWRPYDDNNIVSYCYNNPVICNGGWNPGDESCSQGHIGALCEQCDLYNIRGSGSHSRGGQFRCNICSKLSLNTIKIFLLTIWTLLSIILSVKGNVENVDELVKRIKCIKAGFVNLYIEKVRISVLIKILTNYLQIISCIGEFQLKLSPSIRSMFTYSGNPIKSAMNALDCFLVQLSNIEIIYFRNIWFIILPFYYLAVILIIYFLLIKLKYLEFKIAVLSTTLIFIFIYVQPDIIGSLVSMLSYRNISQVLWVQGNVSYLYLTLTHVKWIIFFVIPILIILGFIIPLILFIKIYYYKDKLYDTLVLKVYGYLYYEYSKATYYWEIIKICQKELIIIFLTFYEDTIIIKGAIVFTIIFCYDRFSRRYKPYKRGDLNKLDSQNSHVCGFSIVLEMAIYYAESNGNTEIILLFYLFMGIFNLYFIIRLITLLIKGYLDKFTDKLDQIRDKINKKYPNIILKHPFLQKYLENSKIKSKRVHQRFLKLREYLWNKVKTNRRLKIIQSDKKLNQEIELQELKLEYNDQISRNYSNQPILQSFSSQRSINQSIILSQDVDQEKINISLDIQMLDNRKLYEKQDLNINQNELIQKNRDQYEPLSIGIDNMHRKQDLQNYKDGKEQ